MLKNATNTSSDRKLKIMQLNLRIILKLKKKRMHQVLQLCRLSPRSRTCKTNYTSKQMHSIVWINLSSTERRTKKWISLEEKVKEKRRNFQHSDTLIHLNSVIQRGILTVILPKQDTCNPDSTILAWTCLQICKRKTTELTSSGKGAQDNFWGKKNRRGKSMNDAGGRGELRKLRGEKRERKGRDKRMKRKRPGWRENSWWRFTVD